MRRTFLTILLVASIAPTFFAIGPVAVWQRTGEFPMVLWVMLPFIVIGWVVLFWFCLKVLPAEMAKEDRLRDQYLRTVIEPTIPAGTPDREAVVDRVLEIMVEALKNRRR